MNYPHDVEAPPKTAVASTRSSQTMRFSSPMPWILAIVLSLALWAVIGWSVWRYLRS